jgi:hypothetical protein
MVQMATTFTAINRGTGAVEIHKQGCSHTKRNARGASVWTIDADSIKDLVLGVYDPDDFSYDADTEWKSFDDLHLAPCMPTLPAEVVTDGRKYRSHAGCTHDRTPKGRAACRKTGGPKA